MAADSLTYSGQATVLAYPHTTLDWTVTDGVLHANVTYNAVGWYGAEHH